MGELRDMWNRMAAGDPLAFMGLPNTGSQGTGSGGTGHGGTGDGGAPHTGSLTQHQRDQLQNFFHQQYGRYPQSEYEFQQWLHHNW